eukprot:c23340_g1_i1.p1 GENE.c23340_g1_i1~~c23340_g1_i1.p1  ORF type:complete len:213 (-),score=26.25 c23340_g1_i1:177-815(-)
MHYNTRSNSDRPRPSAPVNLPDSPSSPFFSAFLCSPNRKPCVEDPELPQFVGTQMFSPHLVAPTPCRSLTGSLFIPRSESYPYLRSDANRARSFLRTHLTNTRKSSETASTSSYLPVRPSRRRARSAFRSVSSIQSDSDLSEHVSDLCLSSSDPGSFDMLEGGGGRFSFQKNDCDQFEELVHPPSQITTRSRRWHQQTPPQQQETKHTKTII